MFINLLEEYEKKALIELLIAISRADGQIRSEEEAFITNFGNEIGVKQDFSSNVNLEKSCQQITKEQSKIIAMQEIIRLALIDGNYDSEERKGVEVIANLLGLSQEKLQNIENWIFEGQRWIEKGEEMLKTANK